MPKDIITDRIPEWRLQEAVARDLDVRIHDGQPFEFAASLEGVRLNPRKAAECRAQGMKAGEPDLRLYFAGRRLVFVELKAKGGRLTTGQKERIPRLRALGFIVHVVEAHTPEAAVALVGAIVDRELDIMPRCDMCGGGVA